MGSLGSIGKLPSISVTSRLSARAKGNSLDLILEEIRCTHTFTCILILLCICVSMIVCIYVSTHTSTSVFVFVLVWLVKSHCILKKYIYEIFCIFTSPTMCGFVPI